MYSRSTASSTVGVMDSTLSNWLICTSFITGSCNAQITKEPLTPLHSRLATNRALSPELSQ